MFTGIVEEKAILNSVEKTATGSRLTVISKKITQDLKIGDSVSVNGVCLSVVKKNNALISFDVMAESIRKTTTAFLKRGDSVNLERALKFQDRISGHFVTGHIDCIGRINSVTKRPNDYFIDIEVPVEKAGYLKEKGSVALDGVSLTVGEVMGNRFRVYIIPITLQTTAFQDKMTGDNINVEFDILSKYASGAKSDKIERIDMDFLRTHGFA